MYRVLIVGTDRQAEEGCRLELQAEGFQVDVVTSTEAAVSRVKSESADLVILDLCMPGEEGVHCLESVRGCNRRVPVVLHTGYPESWGDFRLWSANSFVEKTGDLSRLKDTVRDFLTQA